jgi:hypothetical protein
VAPVAAQGVRRGTWEGAIFWVALFSVAVTVAFGKRQLRSKAIQHKADKERLRRAWEQVETRPELVVSFEWAVMESHPPDRGSQYVKAAIVFRITNNGKGAAHNVRCEIRLDEQRLEPDGTHRKNRDSFFAPYIGPKTAKGFSKKGKIQVYGPTEAHYRCVCDEVGETKGIMEFQVSEKSA